MTIESRRTEDGTIERTIPAVLFEEKVGWKGRHYQTFRGEDSTLLTRCVEEDGPVGIGDSVHRSQAGIQYNNRMPVNVTYVLQESE